MSCLLAVYQHNFYPFDPQFAGLAGLAISYALAITQSLNWSVRMASDLEASMISVERIRSYCQVESEAPRDIDGDNSLPKSWPTGGSVEFSNASLRYRPGLPRVLKGLDIKFPERSKIGVVGRTGEYLLFMHVLFNQLASRHSLSFILTQYICCCFLRIQKGLEKVH